MVSTFGRLETLLRGLEAQQRAVDVIDHNIANANTPGYSRQTAALATTPPYTVPAYNAPAQAGQLGTGVTVQAIQRVREGFLDLQYRSQVQQLGDAEARDGVYSQLQVVFNEPGPNGLNAALEQFWQAWQTLSNRPDDASARVALVQNASSLAASINGVRQQIETQRQTVFQDISMQVSQVNDLAKQIASLNDQISAVLGSGQQPNDLMDQRDQLLDQLSKLVGGTVVTTPDGATNVYLAGHALVNRDRVNAIAASIDSSTGNVQLTWQDDGSTVAISSGTVNGLLDMHTSVFPQVLIDIVNLRDTLVSQVNQLHETGYGLNDPTGPPPGRDFFEVLPNGDVRVVPAIASDPSLIAASGAAQTPGNADVAIAIANARNALTMNAGTASIGDFYQALVARLGSQAQAAASNNTNQDSLASTIDRRRQEVSSVSLDEEAANLVKYQNAYQAAARAMTVVDEMLDRLINNTGTVGR